MKEEEKKVSRVATNPNHVKDFAALLATNLDN